MNENTGIISKITEKLENDPEFTIKAIISLNMLIFAASVIMSGRAIGMTMNPLSFLQPSTESMIRLGASGSGLVFREKMWWTLLSAGYCHASLLHIIFNMLAFMSLGRLTAAVYGNQAMISIYTFSTITGFLLSALAGIPLTVGASAGICGLIGSSIIYGFVAKDALAIIIRKQNTGWIISLVLMGALIPGINNWGHGGGFIGGAAFGFIALKTARWKGIERVHSAIAASSITATILAILIAVYTGLYA